MSDDVQPELPRADRADSTYHDVSFWGLTATQFLGAFNDNIFKQLLLLMFVAVPLADGTTQDMQWKAMFAFAVPFVLFSGYAGFLSDRHSKRTIIVLSKVGECLIMAIGVVMFFLTARWGLTPTVINLLCLNLFLMGAQSTFFGPGKYGILPELLRDRELPKANGFILMTTFLAIIFGIALAGLLKDTFQNRLWLSGVFCVVIALVGTLTSLVIRRTPPSDARLRLTADALAVPFDMRKLLREDRPLASALLASSVFWMAASMVMSAVNALGKNQLQLSDFRTSAMQATISIGIAAGSIVAGIASRDKFNHLIMRRGLYGVVLCLALLALPGPFKNHLLGFWGSVPALIALGAFTGMFAVPLQVFLQSRPPEKLKGRMIATQNLCNWIGIMLSSPLYGASERMLVYLNQPPSWLFAISGMFMLAVALWYRPRDQKLD